MNKLLTFLAITMVSGLILVNSVTAADKPAATNTKKILISQVTDHPALNATTKGIIDTVQGQDIEIRVESAQGSPTIAAQIASKFANQKPDILVGVGTISAQSLLKYINNQNIKIVFSSVTDPVGSNLVKNLDLPDNHITGVSNFVSLKPQLEIFKSLQPNLKRLGIIYNPGETNSVSIIEKLTLACKEYGITLVKQTAAKTADVPQAAVKLANTVDAIFISNDNTALSSIQSVIRAAQTVKIPVYVSDTDVVELGALAALGPNQYDLGVQTGKIINKILEGTDINTIPIQFPIETDLYINLEAAYKADITVNANILSAADKIIEKSKL